MDRDEFLSTLVNGNKMRELREILTEEDIKEIEEGHGKMHEEFKLRPL